MKKIILGTLLVFFTLSHIQAQLPDGSIAPNFTAVDINGNEHTLYDYLGDGKSVIVDFSTTWCTYCWTYHQGHALKNYYETYGPEGTDEVMVFYIESDPGTDMEDLLGNTVSSYGDWVTGTPYPILDDHTIQTDYQVPGYPTVYLICPNKETTRINISGTSPSADGLYSLATQCGQLQVENELKLVSIKEPINKIYCNNAIQPQIVVENNGNNEITLINIIVSVDDSEVLNTTWEGSILTYRKETIQLDEIELADGNHSIEIEVVNNGDDEDVTNNVKTRAFTLNADGVLAELSLFTDNSPNEIDWEISYNDEVIISNPNYTENQYNYIDSVCLDYSYCYNFNLYDAAEDGMHYGAVGSVEISFLGDETVSILGTDYDISIAEEFCILSPENDILSFGIEGQYGETIMDHENKQITIYMVSSIDVTNLIPAFELSEYATAFVDDVEQFSGTSVVDLSGPKYYNIIADNGYESSWAVAVQKITSADLLNQNGISIFPNPSKGNINIENITGGKITIHNIQGITVLEKNLINANQQINLNKLPNGAYFIKIESENKTYFNKLILNK